MSMLLILIVTVLSIIFVMYIEKRVGQAQKLVPLLQNKYKDYNLCNGCRKVGCWNKCCKNCKYCANCKHKCVFRHKCRGNS